ncbi:MAG: hypothetical protein KY469_20475 [Actinobacteria bacterium]|nr:hypothetical protein [Actinomycetota bacterium]
MNSTRTERAGVPSRGPLARRDLLRGVLTAGVGGTLLAAAPARAAWASRDAAGTRGGGPTLDVACLTDTFHAAAAIDTAPPVDGPVYGTPFLVEGVIYEGGSLGDDPTFDPRSNAGLGTWLCRGWIIIRGDRPEPHVVTTQSYLLPRDDELFPADQLVSEGLEGGEAADWAAPRVVVGGTGRYAGARGTVVQRFVGVNATVGPLGNGPNFRFSFDLLPAES